MQNVIHPKKCTTTTYMMAFSVKICILMLKHARRNYPITNYSFTKNRANSES